MFFEPSDKGFGARDPARFFLPVNLRPPLCVFPLGVLIGGQCAEAGVRQFTGTHASADLPVGGSGFDCAVEDARAKSRISLLDTGTLVGETVGNMNATGGVRHRPLQLLALFGADIHVQFVMHYQNPFGGRLPGPAIDYR